MKLQNKAFVAAFVLLTLATLAIAAVDGLSVKRQVKEGQSVKYHLIGNFLTQDTNIAITAMVDSKVTNVGADGSYTIQSLQHDGKATVGAQEISLPDNPAVESIYNANGSLKQIVGDASVASIGAYRVATMQVVIDPGKLLNVGDAWTIDIKPDPKTGVEATKADYKILGEEKVGDLDTLKVQTTMRETTGAEPASSDGTVWLSKIDGSVVKAETKWTNMPIPGSPAPITGTMMITRTN